MLGPVARISHRLGGNYMKNFVRHSSNRGGVPGENLPFDINSKAKLTFHMFWYVGSGLAAPFLVLWYQLRKNSTA